MQASKKHESKQFSDDAAASWQLQTAKARLSEVVRRALTAGPQVITRQGKAEVVVLPIEQYRKMVARTKQPKSIVRFFAESPLTKVDLNLKREPDLGRELDL